MKHGWRLVLFFSGLVCFALAMKERTLGDDGKGNFAVHGLGAQTCQILLEELKADKTAPALAESWLMGYVTAVNRLDTETYDALPVLDSNVLLAIVVNICQQHPDNLVETVAKEIINTLSSARSKHESPILEITNDDRSVHVRVDTLTDMQRKLAQMGYLKNSADGIYNESTKEAISKFQREEKLSITGIPDAPTIIHLLVEIPDHADK